MVALHLMLFLRGWGRGREEGPARKRYQDLYPPAGSAVASGLFDTEGRRKGMRGRSRLCRAKFRVFFINMALLATSPRTGTSELRGYPY